MRLRAALTALVTLMATATLRADVAVGAGFAMLGVSLSLGLAPAVFFIEAIIAHRILREAYSGAILASIVANLASSIAGFVLVSFAPVRFPPMRRFGDDQIVTLMWLCIPFFALSLLIEFDVMRRLMPRHHGANVLRWTIEANIVSYLMIVAVLTFMMWFERSAWLQQLIFSFS